MSYIVHLFLCLKGLNQIKWKKMTPRVSDLVIAKIAHLLLLQKKSKP